MSNRKERGAAQQGGENLGFPGGGRVRPSALALRGQGGLQAPADWGYKYLPWGTRWHVTEPRDSTGP